MIFYKRSSVRTPAPTATATAVAAPATPARRKSRPNDHHNPSEDQLLALQLTHARLQAERERAAQLSSFERELLQAWAQDD